MVELLRLRGYIIFQICVVLLYGLFVIAAFASHGIWYEERADAYFNSDKGELRKDDGFTDEQVLFVTELGLLGLFAIDLVLHVVGYGKLYLSKL